MRIVGTPGQTMVRLKPDHTASATKASPAQVVPLGPRTTPIPASRSSATQARARSFTGTWRELSAALTQVDSLEAAIGALGALGFSLERAKNGHATITRGDFRGRIEEQEIGSHRSLQIELEGGKDQRRSAVAIEGSLLPTELWSELVSSFDATLAAFERVREDHPKVPLPTDFDQLKLFIELGKSKKDQLKDAEQEREVAGALAGVVRQLDALRASGTAPRGVIIYLDGPDAAGKTSTGALLLRALSAAGYDTGSVTFKAPSPDEQAHPFQRFRDRGIPKGDFQALLWDRGPAGDAVYGPPRTPHEITEMARDVHRLEADLAKDGILFFKLHVFAKKDKLASTLGKRLARQQIAGQIQTILSDRGELTAAKRTALEAIKKKIDGDDLTALASFDHVEKAFLEIAKKIGAHVVDSTKRHPARLTAIDSLRKDLDAFASEPAQLRAG